MSASDRIFSALYRITLIVFLLLALTLLVWIGQSIAGNFERQSLVEQERYGALREKLDEDFSGETIHTVNGDVQIYQFSVDQDLDRFHYDQASDVTLVNAKTGQQRRVSDDERRVIWFQSIKREQPETAQNGKDERAKTPAFAYVALLATRDMYKQGRSDLVVGNFATFDQELLANDVPYIDDVEPATDPDHIAILYWDSITSARHIVVSSETLRIVQSTEVALPEMEAFKLDLEREQAKNRRAAIRKERSKDQAPVSARPPPGA